MSTVVTAESELTGTGVAILLVYGAKLTCPRPEQGIPGFRCIVQIDGRVHVLAVGYRTPDDAAAALKQARKVCEDAGLLVQELLNTRTYPGLVVRRRPWIRRSSDGQ